MEYGQDESYVAMEEVSYNEDGEQDVWQMTNEERLNLPKEHTQIVLPPDFAEPQRCRYLQQNSKEF